MAQQQPERVYVAPGIEVAGGKVVAEAVGAAGAGDAGAAFQAVDHGPDAEERHLVPVGRAAPCGPPRWRDRRGGARTYPHPPPITALPLSPITAQHATRHNRLRLHRAMPDYPQGSGHGRGRGDI